MFYIQVHRAVLHNGERVAVKVQRPGLKKLFDIDLRYIQITGVLEKRTVGLEKQTSKCLMHAILLIPAYLI